MYIFLGKGLSLKSQLSKFAHEIVTNNGVVYGLSFPNRKWYIGQSISFWRNRFYSYKNINLPENQKKLINALKKYDWNDISIVIFEHSVDYEDLDDRETFFIDKMDSYKNGYNSTVGGKVLRGEQHPCWGKSKSDNTKKLIGDANRGENNYNHGKTGELSHNYGRKHREEVNYKKGSGFRGKKFSEEHVRKKSEAQTGGKNHRSKKCVVGGKEYDCVADAFRDTGIKETTIGYRISSDNFNGYYYVDVKNSK
jgi:group I intron endonuclease